MVKFVGSYNKGEVEFLLVPYAMCRRFIVMGVGQKKWALDFSVAISV
jgi:hypothetical protein